MALDNNLIEIVIKAVTASAEKGLSSIQRQLADFSVSAKNAQSRSDELKSKLEGIGNAGKVLAVGFGAVSATLGALGFVAIKAAGQMEQQRISFETMLGSAEEAERLLTRLKTLAKTTPFEFKDVVEYSKRLMAMGIAAGDVEASIVSLGNIAAGVGMDKMPQLVLAFGQVRAAGHLTGMELRQFTEAGVPLLDALAQRFGKTTSEIQKMVSDGTVGFNDVKAVLEAMSKEGGKFADLMDKQSKTLGGQFSNLKDSVFELADGFGEHLLPSIKKIVSGIGSLVDWLKKLDPETKKILAWVGLFAFGVTGLVAGVGAFLAIVPMVVAGASAIGVSFSAALVGVPLLIGLTVTALALVIKNVKLIKSVVTAMSNQIDIEMMKARIAVQKFLDSIIRAYNAIAEKVPGLPVINLGFKNERERAIALQKEIQKTEDAILKLEATNRKLKEDFKADNAPKHNGKNKNGRETNPPPTGTPVTTDAPASGGEGDKSPTVIDLPVELSNYAMANTKV